MDEFFHSLLTRVSGKKISPMDIRFQGPQFKGFFSDALQGGDRDFLKKYTYTAQGGNLGASTW